MKTADKLSRIARANQQGMFNLIQNGKVIHNGKYKGCSILANEMGGTFTIEKVKEVDPYEAFQKKVRWGSHQYVRYVKSKCKDVALKGYGSVRITIDRTTDLFKQDAGINSCYSASFVYSLLKQEGFVWGSDYDDQYDAFSNNLIWDNTLPEAPVSMRIGMSWK